MREIDAAAIDSPSGRARWRPSPDRARYGAFPDLVRFPGRAPAALAQLAGQRGSSIGTHASTTPGAPRDNARRVAAGGIARGRRPLSGAVVGRDAHAGVAGARPDHSAQ